MTKEKLKLSVAVYSAEEHVKTFLGTPLEEAFTDVHLIQVSPEDQFRCCVPDPQDSL